MIWMALLLCLLMILPGCQAPAQSKEDTLGKRCDEIVSLYQAQYDAAEKRAPESSREPAELSQQDIDAIEERLMELGLDVVDTSGNLPAYLTTGAAFRDFWSRVQQNRDARQEVLTIRPTGDLGYRLLEYQEGNAMVYSMVRSMEDGIVTDYEAHPVLDWALSDRGNFYYRIFPSGDKHLPDYQLLRLEKPDAALFELRQRYLSAGSYFASNLYLTDWTEADFADLSFNDLWEYLYHQVHGSYFEPQGYDYSPESHCFAIPAEEFEPLIQQYFRIGTEALRARAGYDPDTNTYPWRKVATMDYVDHLNLYTMEPEVTAKKENPDGSLTLTVEVMSTDLKTDCAFSHEVTVLPLEDGGFHFVGNRMGSRGTASPPEPIARLSWRD